MKHPAALIVYLSLIVAIGLLAADAPDKIVFEAKMGNITYDHAKHAERVEDDCTACHDKLFHQSRAPLNYKKAMHRPAEAAKTSCAGCHYPEGAAFATKGNCKKCHVRTKPPAKPQTEPRPREAAPSPQ